jgi:predicted double-glycine peptidase
MDSFKRFFENLIPVPVVYQSHNYDCGAAALRAVCQYWGVGPEDEDDFIKACETDKQDGTHPDDIIRAARAFGLKAGGREGISIEQLKHCIDLHRPVICAIQAWEWDSDEGHYVVAIGYDDNHILFQDPSIKNNMRGRLSYDEFLERWHDVDRHGTILRQYGIVLWREDMPEDMDTDTRASRIKMGKF